MPRKTKFPVLRSTWPRLVDYRQGKLRAIMLDARKKGAGRREYFLKVEVAKARADVLAIQRENHGIASLNFPESDRVMATECRELLLPHGKTLRDATAHYLAYLKAEISRSSSPLVSECIAAFLTARKADLARGDIAKRTLDETRARMNRLSTMIGGMRITDLDADAVTSYVQSMPVAARTRQNVRLRLSKFFAFCRSKRWITVNPCAEIQIKVKRGDVTILTVAEVEALFRAAEGSQFKSVLVPYVALLVFAGLRPHEAQQLAWADVDLETNHVRVRAHTSKKREGRFVRLHPTCVSFLAPYVKRDGKICGPNFRRQFRGLITAAGYGRERPWPQDVLRHTCASMLLAIKQNRALVAEELGTSVDILRRHYRQPILKSEAMKFWAISPQRCG